MTFGGAPRKTLSVTKSSSRVSKMNSPVRAISHTGRGPPLGQGCVRGANSSGRQDQQPTLTLGRKAEAREYVLMSQLREVSNQFILAAAAGEKAEHLSDRDAGAPNARLPEVPKRIAGSTFPPWPPPNEAYLEVMKNMLHEINDIHCGIPATVRQ